MKESPGEIQKQTPPSTNVLETGNPQAYNPGRQKERALGWVILPLRLFLGITFLYGGFQKLTDPQYFDPSARGYIGKQIEAFATGSPIHNFLINVALFHAHLFGALVAYGELAIGIATLLGFLTLPAAFSGLLLNVLFFLSATWRVYPYFYGSDIVFIFCWITLLVAGSVSSVLPTVDGFIVSLLLKPPSSGWRLKLGRVLRVFLGVREKAYPQEGIQKISNNQRRQYPPATIRKNYKQKQGALQQPNKARRSFIWGAVTGGFVMLTLAWTAERLHLVPQSVNNLVSQAPTPAPTQQTPGLSGTTVTNGSSTIIGHTSDVPINNATSFTIPSNGDPGVLIHLNNGQFVAFDAVCTHAGCPVDYDPGTQHLICPCHGAEFDPAHAAAVLGGPTITPLASVSIHVDNTTGTIMLGS